MKRQVTGALLAAGTALAICTAPAIPAAAATSGHETFKGAIVTSGVSGTRTVISTVIVTKGVFRGVGRIVEIANLPGDPDTVSRDDLVFRQGTMHLKSTTVEVSSFSLNPDNCLFRLKVQQIGEIAGGTGKFTHAHGSFTGMVTARGLGARNPDGSCSDTLPPLHEVDIVAGSGTLSF
jgi:hypothetical protein